MTENEQKEKPTLTLCMGSACHQRGVYQVLPQLEHLLASHGLAEKVELKGAFCLGNCAEGITLQCGETILGGVRPENLTEKFSGEILPLLQEVIR